MVKVTSPENRDIQNTTLRNGVRVITEQMVHVRSVSLGVWITTGSRCEAPDENGISHFIEHMVFKGTKHRSAEDIARSVDSIGGGLDAFTAKEDIEKEKGVILEELKMDVDNPEYLIHEIFSSNFWKGHSLGRPILGTRQTIRSFDREQIGRYYKHYYTPKNILITAAGNLSHQKLVRLAADHFGDLEARPLAKNDTKPTPHAPLVFREKSSLEQ